MKKKKEEKKRWRGVGKSLPEVSYRPACDVGDWEYRHYWLGSLQDTVIILIHLFLSLPGSGIPEDLSRYLAFTRFAGELFGPFRAV